MSNSIGQIALDLVVNPTKFKQQMNGITKTAKGSTSQLTGMFKKVGLAVGAAFSVKAIVGFSKECLKLGSDLAEVQNVVDVTFGSMSSAVDKWAKDAMTNFGMSEKVAKEYMGQFGAMSKAFGNTEQMAYDQATALTGLAGDVASFYNMTTDEAFTKLKAVYTGETEALKSLGVVMTQAALDEYALANGYGKTTKAMSEQEKVALRLAFVTDRLSGASGDFVRTADGWANQTRVLALRFDAIKASIGQGLINALLPVVRLLNTLLERLQVVADAFSDFMANIFGDAGSSSSASSAIGDAALGTGAMSSNLGDAASSAKAIKKSLAGFDQLNVLSSGSDGSDAGISAGSSGGGISSGSIGAVDTGLSAGASAAEKLKTFLDEIKIKFEEIKIKIIDIANITGLTGVWDDFLIGIGNVKLGIQNLFGSFKAAIAENAPNFEAMKESIINTFITTSQAITTIWGDMWVITGTKFKEFTENYGPQIQEFLSNLGLEFTNFGTLASTAVGDIFSSLKDWWETDGSRIFGEIQQVLYDVGGVILKLWNEWVHPVIQSIQDAWAELWSNHLKPLWNEILKVITSLWDAIMAIWNNVLKPVVDWLVNRFGPPIVNVCKTIINIFKTIIAGISDGIKAALKGFRGFLDFITGVFTGDWKKAWNGIKTFFSGFWDSMVNIVKTPVNLIIDLIEGMTNGVISGINGMIRALNNLSFDIPDWVPGLGGKKFGLNLKEISTVSIPRLATGGYVAANTPQLAIIGDNKREGEIVAPESKITEAVVAAFRQFLPLFNNGGNNKPIYLTLKLGDGTFWEGFVDYHNDIVMRTGDTPLLI